MKTRIISGAVIAVVTAVLLVLKGWVLFAACYLLSLMGVHEFFKGFKAMNITPNFAIAAGSVTVLYAVAALGERGAGVLGGDMGSWMMAWLFATVVACLLYLFKIEVRKPEDAMATITGIVYVGFFFYHLAAIGMLDGYSIFVWMVMITAFVTDTCAYFSGVFFGKHKMTPVISPKKTWEGAVGGVIGTIIVSGIFGFVFMRPLLVDCMVIGLLGAVISMFGDLTASIFKRKMGIKDYGSLIPGHGGILDRFDSVLFTAPVIYYDIVLVIGA